MELKDLKTLHEQEEPAQGIDLKEILTPYLRRWRQFVATFIICISIGIAYLLTTPKTYNVSSSIKLTESTETNSLGAIASQVTAFNMFGGGSTNVDNELANFRSRTLQKKAIIELNLYVTYKGYKGMKEEDIYTESPYQVIINDIEKADESENPILLKFVKKGNNYTLSYTDQTQKKELIIDNPTHEIQTSEFGKLIITKRANSVWKNDFTALVTSPRLIAIDYNEAFEVGTTTKSSSIVTFNLPTQNIHKAKDFMSTILTKYNDVSEKEKRMEAASTLSFVKERLDSITLELSDIEQEVEKYKMDNNILDLKLEAKASVEQNYETQVKLNELETQKILLDFIDKYISDTANLQTAIPTMGINEIGLQTMIATHNSYILETEILKASTNKEHRAFLIQENRIINSIKTIKESILNLKKGIELSILEFKKIDNSYQSEKKLMPSKERIYVVMRRKQLIKEGVFTFLSQKCEESILNLSIGMPKATFIDLPDAEKKHKSPRGSVILMITLIATIILPISFHLTRDTIKAINNSKKANQ